MNATDDITRWIGGLSTGDQQAGQALWQAYFDRLTRVARRRLGGRPRRQADEEDIALSAMHTFYRGMRDGRYSQLAGRDELWRLLVTIVIHKVSRQQRREGAQKRGGGKVKGESAFLGPKDGADGLRGIEQMLSAEPTPAMTAEISESCQHLMAALEDETLRQIAGYKLEGYTNGEIAYQVGCTTRSVERKLNRIRARWNELGLS